MARCNTVYFSLLVNMAGLCLHPYPCHPCLQPRTCMTSIQGVTRAIYVVRSTVLGVIMLWSQVAVMHQQAPWVSHCPAPCASSQRAVNRMSCTWSRARQGI